MIGQIFASLFNKWFCFGIFMTFYGVRIFIRNKTLALFSDYLQKPHKKKIPFILWFILFFAGAALNIYGYRLLGWVSKPGLEYESSKEFSGSLAVLWLFLSGLLTFLIIREDIETFFESIEEMIIKGIVQALPKSIIGLLRIAVDNTLENLGRPVLPPDSKIKPPDLTYHYLESFSYKLREREQYDAQREKS